MHEGFEFDLFLTDYLVSAVLIDITLISVEADQI